MNVTRTVDPTAGKFDIGGTIEFMYGFDAGAIHSDGLFSYYRSRDFGPENQFDLVQAFVDRRHPDQRIWRSRPASS